MRAMIGECDAGAGYEVAHRAGDHDLASLRVRRNPRAGVHGNPGDLPASHLTLSCMQACANPESQLPQLADDPGRAPDRAGWTVKGGKETISRSVDLAAAVPGELAANDLMVALEHLEPSPVAEFGSTIRGVDDVGEEDGREEAIGRRLLPSSRVPDLVQKPACLGHDAIGVRTAQREVPDPRELDEPSSRDLACEVAGRLKRHQAILYAVEDERGDANQGKDVTDVDVLVHPQQRLEHPRACPEPEQVEEPSGLLLAEGAERLLGCECLLTRPVDAELLLDPPLIRLVGHPPGVVGCP